MFQAGRAYILDASSQEETCIDSAIQVAVNGGGGLCGLFKVGPSAVNPAVLQVRLHFNIFISCNLLCAISCQSCGAAGTAAASIY